MRAPPKPTNEQARLTALDQYEILDSAPEADFDTVIELIAAICEAPIAACSIIAADRQWFKSQCGLGSFVETARDSSFCGHTILEPGVVMVVPDATTDERFCDNPIVTGPPNIRFYAGVPLVDADGFALGALCIIDTHTRTLTAHQIQTLRLAARTIVSLLALRKLIAQLRISSREQQVIAADLRAEIAQRERVEGQLNFSSLHDVVTQLPNRAEFLGRVALALESMRGDSRHGFAVCSIDLDNFKQINDTLGHHAGNEVLVAVGRRLTDVMRSGDAIARLGGDEFTVLIDGVTSNAAATAIGSRIAAVLDTKLRVAEKDIAVTASVGIVLVADSYTSVEDVMRDADIAMYAAKERGRNRATIFSYGLRAQFALAGELQSALRTALDRQQFQLFYQPIFSLQRQVDRPSAFEALLRWQQADGTFISAMHFVDAAERSGLIVELGDWVLREACAQARRWQALPNAVVTSVNVSGRQFAEPDFVRKVKHIVRAAELDPRLLALEVTETSLIADIESSISMMHELRQFGLKLYLDDFGTGYSSLNYLRRFPLDRLKIDRSFVSSTGQELVDPIIVHSIISLAHKLDVRVVAEGVETRAQQAALTQLDCDFAQGFLYSCAIPASQAALLLLPDSVTPALADPGD